MGCDKRRLHREDVIPLALVEARLVRPQTRERGRDRRLRQTNGRNGVEIHGIGTSHSRPRHLYPFRPAATPRLRHLVRAKRRREGTLPEVAPRSHLGLSSTTAASISTAGIVSWCITQLTVQEHASGTMPPATTTVLGTSLGDKSWGQVRGSSGPLGAARGTLRRGQQSRIEPRKTRREARLLRPAADDFNLHGKEGVDGSSPSEGFKIPANRDLGVVCADSRVRRGQRKTEETARLQALLPPATAHFTSPA